MQRGYVVAQFLRVREVSRHILGVLFQPPLFAQQRLLIGNQPVVLATENIVVSRHAARHRRARARAAIGYAGGIVPLRASGRGPRYASGH